MSVQISLFEKADTKSSKAAGRVEEIVGDGFDVKKFVENFDMFVEASNGVKNLRSLVLKLGLAGRLGTNEPSEPPSPVHLAGEPDPSKPPPHRNWIVCHLPDVADIEMGNSPPGTSYNEHGAGVPLINGPVEFSPGPFGLTRRTKFTTAPARMCRRGDLLVCVRGATTGRTNVADFDACIGRGVALVRARKNQGYLNYYMWSVGNDLLAAGTGTTFPAISRDDLVALVVLLPPIAEQKRIVAKVDELMRLLDDLETKQTKKRETQARLRRAALEALTSAEGPEEFEAAWKRVAENFGVLFERAKGIGELRELILDLALRGSLSEQRDSDGRADELLLRLARERDHAGSRAARSSSGVLASPFSIPRSWAWARLDQLWDSIADGDHQPPPKEVSGIAFLTIGNVSAGALDFGSTRYVSKAYFSSLGTARVPREGDLLYTVVGSFGIPVVVNTSRPFCVQRHIAILRPLPSTLVSWMYYWMRSGFVLRQAKASATGIAQPTVGLGSLRAFAVPVPPLQEQHRIVAKVEQLMKLCDDLEAKLQRAEDTAAKLVEAVVSEMVA